MPRPYSTYIRNPKWDDPKKVHSREETIVTSCRNYIGDSIPAGTQYWTLAGAYEADDHPMDQSCLEMNQLIEAGIIERDQYHGVDLNEEVIEKNRHLYPDAHWHHGDFLRTMKALSSESKFHPGFINYDGVMQKKFGVKYLKDILRFIDNNVFEPLVLTANFCLNNPYKNHAHVDTGREVFEALKKEYRFPSFWLVKPSFYVYNGSGRRSTSWMATFVFVKEGHFRIPEFGDFEEEVRFLEE